MDKAILSEFEAIGVDLDSDSLGKCKWDREISNTFQYNWLLVSGCEICTVQNITDAEEFVEQWMAYSLTKFGGADPTVVRLTDFQLKAYQKDQENHAPQMKSNDDHRNKYPNKRSRGSNASSILNTYGFNDSTAVEKVRKRKFLLICLCPYIFFCGLAWNLVHAVSRFVTRLHARL